MYSGTKSVRGQAHSGGEKHILQEAEPTVVGKKSKWHYNLSRMYLLM